MPSSAIATPPKPTISELGPSTCGREDHRAAGAGRDSDASSSHATSTNKRRARRSGRRSGAKPPRRSQVRFVHERLASGRRRSGSSRARSPAPNRRSRPCCRCRRRSRIAVIRAAGWRAAARVRLALARVACRAFADALEPGRGRARFGGDERRAHLAFVFQPTAGVEVDRRGQLRFVGRGLELHACRRRRAVPRRRAASRPRPHTLCSPR